MARIILKPFRDLTEEEKDNAVQLMKKKTGGFKAVT